MAIRLRRVEGTLIVICAAKSRPKDGDIYLNDEAGDKLAENEYDDLNWWERAYNMKNHTVDATNT